WSMSHQDSRGVLGFAVHRTDHKEGEAYWLEGIKVFQSTDPGTARASLRNHPVQGFTWSDFSAKPAHRYTYRVQALHGSPASLSAQETIEVTVDTANEDNGTHGVWFNRGSAGSQEYAHRFQNRPPKEVGQPAFTWLSRGLWEAMLAFVDEAKDGQ